MERYCEKFILDDLKSKMVFVGGPREVGKTALCNRILKCYQSGEYFNYEKDQDREHLNSRKWSSSKDLIVFDEL
jgi:hypothetical protein